MHMESSLGVWAVVESALREQCMLVLDVSGRDRHCAETLSIITINLYLIGMAGPCTPNESRMYYLWDYLNVS